jgi:hypothetical protein
MVGLHVSNDRAAGQENRVGQQIACRADLGLPENRRLVRREEKRPRAGILRADIAP